MQFLYPGFLWGLLALAIPVIIHLFYFRRFKRIYFTNVKFLKEIKEETSSRNKLKNLLILAMRLAAVACLVFAFAQPFIPTGENVKLGEKAVSIYIDNSFSMAAEKENIPLLDLAKERAVKIVNAYGEETRFQILTADFEGRHQRLVNKDEARQCGLLSSVRLEFSRYLEIYLRREASLLNDLRLYAQKRIWYKRDKIVKPNPRAIIPCTRRASRI